MKDQNIKIIKDLFQWEKVNYEKLKLKVNFVHDIMEIVEKVRDQN